MQHHSWAHRLAVRRLHYRRVRDSGYDRCQIFCMSLFPCSSHALIFRPMLHTRNYTQAQTITYLLLFFAMYAACPTRVRQLLSAVFTKTKQSGFALSSLNFQRPHYCFVSQFKHSRLRPINHAPSHFTDEPLKNCSGGKSRRVRAAWPKDRRTPNSTLKQVELATAATPAQAPLLLCKGESLWELALESWKKGPMSK